MVKVLPPTVATTWPGSLLLDTGGGWALCAFAQPALPSAATRVSTPPIRIVILSAYPGCPDGRRGPASPAGLSKPAQSTTGSRGYLGNAGSVRPRVHSTNVDRGVATSRRHTQVSHNPGTDAAVTPPS